MGNHRLQKIIANSGLCSRREAERLLSQSRVKVNGQPARPGDQANPAIDLILVDEEPLKLNLTTKVFLINKPSGVISTCQDPQGRETVLDLMPNGLREGLHPIGRLDYESRGALILTNHGELTLRLTHPRYLHKKTYLAWVKGIPSEKKLEKWRQGIVLDGKLTIKASVEILQKTAERSQIKVIISEGRNKQIRRIANLLDHPVIDLQRTAIADITLDNLQERNWRVVSEKEWRPILNMNSFKSSEK